MTIALDLGASVLRSIRVSGERLAARSARAIYSAVEDAPARRQMLEQLGMSYAICDGSIAVPGDAARDLAELFHVPLLTLLPEGRLPQGDPPARQMLASLIDALLPPPSQANELCAMTLPGNSGADLESETARFFLQLVRLRGYSPLPILQSTALVLAELVNEGFTGIGMSFGSSACHVSLINRSREVATVCVEQAGSWIDAQLAELGEQYIWDARGNKYLDEEAMRRWKESGVAQLDEPTHCERERNLARLYREVVENVVAKAGREFKEKLLLPDSWPAMSIVVSGGATRVRGFIPMLAQTIREANWPIRVKQIRQAEDSDLTIARGALIHSELEAQSAMDKAA